MKPCLIGNIIIVSAQVWRPAERFSQLVWVFARFERSITRALGHQESGTAFGRGKDPRGWRPSSQSDLGQLGWGAAAPYEGPSDRARLLRGKGRCASGGMNGLLIDSRGFRKLPLNGEAPTSGFGLVSTNC